MSRAPHQDVNVMEADDYQYPPHLAQNQAAQGVSNFVDGSGPIFSMYLEMASEEDKKMTEGWKADADGILIFTGLFSAAVASLISVSIQDIRPNPQDTSNFYLANIYQTISNPNQSDIPLPSSPPPFSPPAYAVWVNSLWFLSLVISISCALLATLLQQWARRYLKANQLRYRPHKRARIRAFFAEGVDKFLLPWAVEALPTLLHISLFLFFAGLVVFLWNINLTIFKLTLSWVGICTALYGCITLMPIFRHDNPYYTPLSSPAWHIVTGIAYVIYGVLRWFTWHWSAYSRHRVYSRFRDLEDGHRKMLMQGMQRTAEETALNASSEIDTRTFMWTFDSLDEDHELERFFSSLPGFRSSKVVDDPLPSLTEEAKEKLSGTLIGFLDRTSSSDLLPEPVKSRRATVCAKALDPAQFPSAYVDVLYTILSRDEFRVLETTKCGRILRGWGNSGNEDTALVGQSTASFILVRAQRRDDSWFVLASSELGVPETVLRDYAAHGDNLSLAILIHITRQQFSHFWKLPWPGVKLSETLEAASGFDVQDTSPELQHNFCALWNQIVLEVQKDNSPAMVGVILRPIRHIYTILHQDTDSAPTRFCPSTDNWDGILFEPSSYPLCNLAGHIHDDSPPTSLACPALLAPASLAAPSSSVPVPLHVVESLTGVPLLNSSHCTLQTIIENFRVPATSQDPVTVIKGDTSTTMVPLSIPGPSASTPPPPSMALTTQPGAVAIQHIAGRRTSSDVLDDPSLPSTFQVLDDTPPTDYHSSPLVPTPGPPRPPLFSAPDPGVVV